MKPIFYTLLLFLIFSCASENKNNIAQKEDYNKYLVSQPTNTTSKYFELWNKKIRPDSMQLTSFAIVGGEYNRYFGETGNITFLKKAGQSLKKAAEIAAVGKEGHYRSLARNYISQHRFKEALELAELADKTSGGSTASHSLLFDIHMELGNYDLAEKYLDSLKNLSDFGYLIRIAKWNDYKGDLDTTINFMEKAKVKAESSKNRELMLWSYTNLADYYGHAGRIEDSYNHYLKALKLDEKNAYAKKGIAWIAFSHDKNPNEALRILDSVTLTYDAPDYYLLKAEIADYLNDDFTRMINLDKYFIAVSNPDYGDMYNAYNVGLYLEETEQLDQALALAEKEVANRPTSESYSWLAYSYLKKGDKEKAAQLIKEHVDGKTFEPALLYQAAEVYKANGNMAKVKELKRELIGAIYELGPSMEKQIKDL
jgi:tetratricopeptide (TPR) repeat protein